MVGEVARQMEDTAVVPDLYLQDLAEDFIRELPMYVDLVEIRERYEDLADFECERILEYVHLAKIEVSW